MTTPIYQDRPQVNPFLNDEQKTILKQLGWDEREEYETLKEFRENAQKIPHTYHKLAYTFCTHVARKSAWQTHHLTSIWRDLHGIELRRKNARKASFPLIETEPPSPPSRRPVQPQPTPKTKIETQLEEIQKEQEHINELQRALDEKKQAVKALIQERRKKLEELERYL